MPSEETTWLLYDGECPFCSAFVKMVRFKATVGNVELRDARDYPALVGDMDERGLVVDDGIILSLDGRLHYGADAMHMIALLSTPVGVFNRVNRWVMASPGRSRLLYPVLVRGRKVLLRMLGRSRLGATDSRG